MEEIYKNRTKRIQINALSLFERKGRRNEKTI